MVTPDLQDLRAANRWLELVAGDDETLFRVVVNRTRQTEEAQLRRDLWRKIAPDNPLNSPGGLGSGPDGPPQSDLTNGLIAMRNFEDRIIFVTDQTLLGFFGEERLPPSLEELLTKLSGE